MAGVVGDDRAGAVDRAHQLPHDPVGADRPGVRGQARQPPVHELRPHPRDRVGRRRGRPGAVGLAEEVEHLPEHEPRIADAAELDAVAAADVARVVDDLTERRAGRERRDVERAGEARADAEDDVGALEEAVDGGGARARGGAERERVVLGEGALAVQGGRDRHAGALGQAHELGAGAGVEHPLPREDDRVGRLGEDVHGLGDVCGRGLGAPRRREADVPVGVAGGRVQDVVCDGDQDGAVAHDAQRVERPPEHVGRVAGGIDRGREPGHGPVGLLGAQVRWRVLAGAVVLARDEQDRAAVAVGLRDRAERRLGAGPVLGHAGGDALAVARAGEAVGDVDRHPLGAGDDRPHAQRGGGVEQPVLGEPDHELRPLTLEETREPVGDEHLTFQACTSRCRAHRHRGSAGRLVYRSMAYARLQSAAARPPFQAPVGLGIPAYAIGSGTA